MTDLTAKILDAVARPGYHPVKPKALAKRLNLTTDDAYAAFRQTLRALVRDGRLVVVGGSAIKAADASGSVVGVFRRTASGLGFVRPNIPSADTGPEVRIRDGKALDASSGDEVLVKLTRKETRGGFSAGEVTRVLSRATRTFVGTYFERDGGAYVKIDGTMFAHSVSVGDPGAKGAKAQDKVVIEMLRFPAGDEARGEGVITEVLGPLSQPGVDTLSVIRAFGLPEEFPEAALDEARAQADAFRDNDLAGRTDFTDDCVVTIDPVDARDFDDAVSVTFDDATNHWVLTVHIADVGHFARPGTALDSEARRRATSVYLPQKVIPMFPEVISNGLASLQEGKLRYVKSVRIEFTANLQKADVKFYNGAIRVRKRFAYGQVRDLLAGGDPGTPVDGDVRDLLGRMETLATALRKKRFRRGALELTMPEAVLEYDGDGRVSGAHFAEHDLSHQIVEEFMLAANEAVAEHFAQYRYHFLRRVHPAPKEEKIDAFAEFARVLGYPMERSTDRFELQRVLDATAKKPERAAIHFSLLRSLKQASYSPVQDEHYALAMTHYCHFTSPIRRYPDLSVHRQLDRWIRTGSAQGALDELKLLGDHCSKMERRAEQAERELVKLKVLQYLAGRVGEKLDAVITGVADYGFFAQAEKFPAEGLVHVSSLADDFYSYDESSHALYGGRTRKRYRLGDRVRVQVAHIDLPRRMLDFRLTQDQPEPAERPRKRKKGEPTGEPGP